jgi:hypothetical protein
LSAWRTFRLFFFIFFLQVLNSWRNIALCSSIHLHYVQVEGGT